MQVHFHCLNVFESIEKISGKFDVIFFNNLLIYLNPPHVAKILDILKSLLYESGYLVVDSTELPRCREVFKTQNLGSFVALKHPDSKAGQEKFKTLPPSSSNSISTPQLTTVDHQASLKKLESSILQLKNESRQHKGLSSINLIEQAKQATQSKNFEDAISLYEQVLKQYPEDKLFSLCALSQLYADQGHTMQAMETAELALSESQKSTKQLTNSQQADLHAILALGYQSKGLSNAAIGEINKIKALDANHPIGKLNALVEDVNR
mgnify:CR=1 FL=1